MVTFERGKIREPELLGDFWFNSEPISLRELRGSVVLIDFWDYSNNDCLRTQHYVKTWDSRYRSFDLILIGVHTPQFKFGRNPENVEEALRKLDIEYPVVMDNDALIWAAFSARMWPTRVLIDRDGFIRFLQQGEGNYEQFERAIQLLLVEAGFHGVLPDLLPPVRDTDYPGAICFHATTEIQLGYLKGTLGNTDGHAPESTLLYDDEGMHLSGRVYLNGKWYNDREGMRFDGEDGEEGRASLTYEAVEVNTVMTVETKYPGRVFALQDRHPLTKDNAGLDVRFDEAGRSYIVVDGPGRFNIVCNREFGQHELMLMTDFSGVEILAFSFVTGVIPELVSTN